MNDYSLSHLADHVVLHELSEASSRERGATAAVLALIAEVDERGLHRAAAHASMYAYCVHELNLSEDEACRRIAVARTARRFPALFPALADGRLNLSGVQLLAPHLARANAEELIALAAHQSGSRIRELLAARFPQPDLPTVVGEVEGARACASATGSLALSAPARIDPTGQAESVQMMEPLQPAPRPRLTPLSSERVALQVTLARGTYEKLRYAQDLLGHALPSGDLAQVLDRALDSLIEQLEKRRFAKGARSRSNQCDPSSRYVPAAVRQAVWQRDGGQCTFVSARGRRCDCRRRLEFDHIRAYAVGGEATVENLRLRCRAHNQYEAERAFGRDRTRGRRAGAG